MEIKEMVTKSVIIGYQCDICNKSCSDKCLGSEYATLYANWGYGSNKDGESHLCHICESCYDKVRNFIEKELGGKIDENPY